MISQALLDHATKPSGLICIAGDRFSGVDQTLVSLTQSLQESRVSEPKGNGHEKGIMILRGSPQTSQIESPFLIVQYSELIQPLVQKRVEECHYLIFEKVKNFDELEWSLQLAEEGHMVIVHVATNSICSLLHRLFSMWPSSQNLHYQWRFADQLQLLINQVYIRRAARGLFERGGNEGSEGSEFSIAYEMALSTPLVKKHLVAGNLEAFEAELRKTEDKSGFLSLNQSLLQLLIRRKIDISAAFQSTRDPEDLNNLLKKVGL
ncbi:MAG: hypothetical protein JNM39_07770 [Bdellovibrionaceae bacterium]|nr:hypothetical protein [Pseudobdellovibrionaceae bacterium]